MADGYVMTIPKQVLEKLTLADEKIKAIANSSKSTQRTFINSFQKMADGVNPLIEKLQALQSLKNIKINASFKQYSSDAEKAANSVANVAIQLSKVANAPIDTAKAKLSLFKTTIVDTSEKVSKLDTNITGMLSSIINSGNLKTPVVLDKGQADALKLQRAELEQSDRYWKQYIDNLSGTSLAAQRQQAEMEKLNASFREGQSELQKRAKLTDDYRRSIEEANKADENRINKANSKAENAKARQELEATKAVEQYEKALNKSEATLTQRARKIEALTNAQSQLTATGRDYSNYISKIDSEIKRLNQANASAANSIKNVSVRLKEVNQQANTSNVSKSANVSLLAWQGINESLKTQQTRLQQLNQSIKEYQINLANINSGKGGSVSVADQNAYQLNLKEAEAIRQSIALLQQKQQAVVNYALEQKKLISNEEALRNIAMGKTSLPEEKQKAELEKLNQAYRTGQSELQKITKAENDFWASVVKVATALDKAALAEKKRTEVQSSKADKSTAKAEETYSKALAKSEATIVQRKRKIEALANAERALIATGREYSDRLTKIAAETQRLNKANSDAAYSMKNLQKHQSSVLNTTDQLARKFALLFSVSSIQGYFQELIKVRGEFELQQRALQSILQNKEKADEVWSKTVQLAVRSPFTVKELVTYTKQLAAYRIEADKLYDTNKMLADVSAGLGVSMDRLILAFGQVKAANYLRASEVRQFTEAGVNILGELANYYTELEGKMVSVGDVQERITKRMVAFGDVEEIFKRITSAGGIFYNMQEVQAETLAGMMSNLKDTFDLMYNEMGKANDGVLKGFVTLLKDIVGNWETIGRVVIPIIATLAGRFLLLKSAQMSLAGGALSRMFKITVGGFQMMKAQLTNNIRLTTVLQQRMKMLGTTSLGGWTAALSAVVIIVWEIYSALSAAKKEQEELNKIAAQGQFDAMDKAANYKRLANVISDATASYEEQDAALKELKRTYGDILPAHLLEAKTIRELQGNYEEATNAIYDYVAAKTKEARLRYISENAGKEVNDNTQELAEGLKKYIKDVYKAEVSTSRLNGILNLLNKEFENGEVTADNYGDRLKELFSEYLGLNDISLPIVGYSGKTLYAIQKGYSNLRSISMSLVKSLSNYTDQMNAEMQDSTIKFGNFITTNLNEEKKSIDAKAKELQGALKTLVMSQDEKSIVTDEQVKAAEKKILDFYASIGKEAPKLSEIINNSFLVKKETLNLNKLVYTDWLKDISKRTVAKSDFATYQKYMENLQNSIDNFDGTEFQQYISNSIEEFGKLNNVDLNGFDKLLADSEENIDSYVKKLATLIPALKEEIYLLSLPGSYAREGKTEEEIQGLIDNLTTRLKYAEEFTKNNTYKEDKNKGGESEAEKRLKKQLSLLKEIGKEYENNLKYYSKEEALAKTRADYASAAKEAGIGDVLSSATLDPKGLIAALEKVGKNASAKVKLEFERAIASIRGEIEVDVKVKDIDDAKKQLDNAFAGYELSVEMGKLGLDKSLVSQLFKVDTSSLEDIKQMLKDMYPDVSKLSKEQLKVYEDSSKKIADFEKKSLETRLKDYTQYLKRSVSERVRIEMEGQKKIAEIPNEFRPDQREEITQNIKKETQTKLDKQQWTDFQDSDLYIKLFEDLDNVSTKTLNTLKQKLLDLKESLKDLPANELRAITSQIKKVEDELTERNPFKGLGKTLKDYIKSLGEAKRLEKERTKSLSKESELDDQIKTQERYYKLKEEEYNNAVKTYGVDSKQAKEAKAKLQSSYDILSSTKSELALQKGVTGEIEDQQDEARKLGEKLAAAAAKFSQRMGEVNNLLSDIQSAFGGMMSDSANDMLSSTQEIIGGTIKMADGIGKIASGDIFGGIMGTLGGLASTIGSVFDIGDKKREREIQKEIKLVEDLQRAYEKLEKAIDDAYTIDTLNKSYDNAENNLIAQNESLQRMIDAEDAKKKTDKDKIKEWQNQIEENNDKILELQQAQLEKLGGFGSGANIASAAEEFASAWMEAYRETGSGLDALNEKWDEFINNIIVKQLSLRGAQKLLEPVMKLIDESLAGDSFLSADELEAIQNKIKETGPKLDKLWTSVMEGFGDLIPDKKDESDLTGMQKSVQGITADQAGIIEAYLNSMRFFVADSNMQLQKIALFFNNDPAQNPLYTELMSQTRLLRSIDDRLASVITAAGNHPLSGFAIKSII